MWKQSLLVAILAAGSQSAGAASLKGVDRTIEHDGRTREYRLFAPRNLDRQKPAPLVFALHGGGGDGVREEARVAYNDFAARDGWIVVYPSAVDHHWNDLRGYEDFTSQRENIDDVGLIEALIDALSSEIAIDQKRIFVTGGSNGGLMSHTIAARLADRVAAIAPIVGSMPRPIYEDFHPSRPLSVMMINDKGDPLVLWQGGDGGRANFVSMPQTIAKWKQVNGCDDAQTDSAGALDGVADDAPVSHTVWSGCKDSVHMELYVVEANRHGHPRAVLDKQNGRRVYEVIWDFFKQSGRN